MTSDFHVNEGILTLYTGTNDCVVIPEGITTIGPDAFAGNSLRTVVLCKSVHTIDDRAFEGCHNLTRVILPLTGLKRIGRDAFRECYNLSSIHLPEGLEEIGEYAFSETALKTIILSSSLKILKDGVFAYSCNLETAILGEIQILEAAFVGCHNLSTVLIPDSLRKMKSSQDEALFLRNNYHVQAFEFCKDLEVVASERWKKEHEYIWYRIQKTLERAKEGK